MSLFTQLTELCSEVGDLIDQEAVDVVDNQLQGLGASVSHQLNTIGSNVALFCTQLVHLLGSCGSCGGGLRPPRPPDPSPDTLPDTHLNPTYESSSSLTSWGWVDDTASKAPQHDCFNSISLVHEIAAASSEDVDDDSRDNDDSADVDDDDSEEEKSSNYAADSEDGDDSKESSEEEEALENEDNSTAGDATEPNMKSQPHKEDDASEACSTKTVSLSDEKNKHIEENSAASNANEGESTSPSKTENDVCSDSSEWEIIDRDSYTNF